MATELLVLPVRFVDGDPSGGDDGIQRPGFPTSTPTVIAAALHGHRSFGDWEGGPAAA